MSNKTAAWTVLIALSANVALGMTKHIAPSGGDYTNFQLAVNALSGLTLTEDWEFRVAAGTYNHASSVVFPAFNSNGHQVLFKPEAGVTRSQVVVTKTLSPKLVFDLPGGSVDSVVFQDLTVVGSMRIQSGSDGCIVRACSLDGGQSASRVIDGAGNRLRILGSCIEREVGSGAGIYCSGSGLLVRGCLFPWNFGTGTATAMYCSGDGLVVDSTCIERYGSDDIGVNCAGNGAVITSSRIDAIGTAAIGVLCSGNGLVLDSCQIDNTGAWGYGVSLGGSDRCRIRGCTIGADCSIELLCSGTNTPDDDSIIGNSIYVNNMYYCCGVRLAGYDVTARAQRTVIANNFISDFRSFGFHCSYHAGTVLCFNTIQSRADFYSNQQCVCDSFGQDVTAKDNIYSVDSTTTDYAYYRTSGSGTFTSNNNCFWKSGSNQSSLCYDDGDKSWAQWRLTHDPNSINQNPLLVSDTAPYDLHILGGSPCILHGVAIPGITTDIDGEPRWNPPAIGADEYYAPIPSLLGIQPPTGSRLRTLDVLLTGSGFVQGVTTPDFGPGITVNSVVVGDSVFDSNNLTANITIAESVPTGPLVVTVRNRAPGGGIDSLKGGFTVTDDHVGEWTARTSLPGGGKNKNVKDGGALAYAPPMPGLGENDTGFVYAFKGNNTYEFYRYNTTSNAWVPRDSIPAIGRSLKKKAVKKGAALVVGTDGNVYGAKGNNTLEFWCYDPVKPAGLHWTQLTDVPTGGKALKEGTGLAALGGYIYVLKGSGTFEFYRYGISAGSWETMTNAPGGYSTKPYKYGSSIVSDGGDTIWTMKGTYNELAAYSVSGKNWITKDTLPKKAPSSTKKTKVKDGSQIAYSSRVVYALKGGNTNEFWTYKCNDHTWYAAIPMTSGSKNVKGGGGLVYADNCECLYAFRGNNTLEFWGYPPRPADGLRLAGNGDSRSVQGQSAARIPRLALSVTPNPFTNRACISYSLPRAGNVSLRLYDVSGQLVTTLVRGYTLVGSHSAHLDASRLARGIYVLKYENEGNTLTSKLIIE